MEATKTLAEWVAERGITIDAKLLRRPTAKKHDDWQQTSFEWDYTIKHQGRECKGKFFTGSGCVDAFKHPKSPKVADVISCLCSDASACEQDFDEWCGEFGYDTDSRKALDTYLACQESGRKAKALLGKDFDEVRGLEH